MALTYEERVANGIKVLDAYMPNWWTKVVVIEFSIAHPCKCILGQVFKDHCASWDAFNVGKQALRLDALGLVDCGFDADSENTLSDFAALNMIWKREISARQNGVI